MSRFIDKQNLAATTAAGDAALLRPDGIVDLRSSASALKSAAKTCLVRLEKTAYGAWDVRNESGDRGGRFRDYKSAKVFIRREFADLQPTLIVESVSNYDA